MYGSFRVTLTIFQVDNENIRCMLEKTYNTLPKAANYALQAPITMDEL